MAHLEENVAPGQIKRKRARLLIKNMTLEQVERRAAYYRRYRAQREAAWPLTLRSSGRRTVALRARARLGGEDSAS